MAHPYDDGSFSALRTQHVGLFAAALLLEQALGHLEPSQDAADYDSDVFCSHFPAAFVQADGEVQRLSAAVQHVTTHVTRMSDRLFTGQTTSKPDDAAALVEAARSSAAFGDQQRAVRPLIASQSAASASARRKVPEMDFVTGGAPRNDRDPSAGRAAAASRPPAPGQGREPQHQAGMGGGRGTMDYGPPYVAPDGPGGRAAKPVVVDRGGRRPYDR